MNRRSVLLAIALFVAMTAQTSAATTVVTDPHTSGLHDFSLQLRMDRGLWVSIASGTATTARSTLNRIRGHWYGLRVRARDQAGNLGPWSRELRVWLP